IMAITTILVIGIKESANFTAAVVVLKVAVVCTFIALAGAFLLSHNFKPNYWHPFIPKNTGEFGTFGISGIFRGAGVIFFAYIGFDAVSTAAQEARDPQRTMPIGIIGSLVICTILYVAFAIVLTGMVSYRDMKGDAAPVATAIDLTPYPWLQMAVKLGIICGFTSVMLVLLYGQS